MYLRKIRPRTTCLYSAASMLERSLSAASQSLASKPSDAEEFFADEELLGFDRAIPGEKLVEFSPVSSGKEQGIRNGVEPFARIRQRRTQVNSSIARRTAGVTFK